MGVAYRIVADHLRMTTVCMSDGLFPGQLSDAQRRLGQIMNRMFAVARRQFNAQPGFITALVPCVAESLVSVSGLFL